MEYRIKYNQLSFALLLEQFLIDALIFVFGVKSASSQLHVLGIIRIISLDSQHCHLYAILKQIDCLQESTYRLDLWTTCDRLPFPFINCEQSITANVCISVLLTSAWSYPTIGCYIFIG